jgi:hypothetical protein
VICAWRHSQGRRLPGSSAEVGRNSETIPSESPRVGDRLRLTGIVLVPIGSFHDQTRTITSESLASYCPVCQPARIHGSSEDKATSTRAGAVHGHSLWIVHSMIEGGVKGRLDLHAALGELRPSSVTRAASASRAERSWEALTDPAFADANTIAPLTPEPDRRYPPSPFIAHSLPAFRAPLACANSPSRGPCASTSLQAGRRLCERFRFFLPSNFRSSVLKIEKPNDAFSFKRLLKRWDRAPDYG